MSYEIIVTYTKTADTPEDVWRTMPTLKPDAGFTQEQITAFLAAHPMTWDTKVVLDQLILHYTFPSKEAAAARSEDPVSQDIMKKQNDWQEANHLTRTSREI